jgi:hypothetical protein
VKTYFIAMQVTPLPDNPLIAKIEEAYVYFWIVDSSPENTMERAKKHLSSYLWKVKSIDTEPMEATAADFADQEEGLKGFWRAKQKGFAAQFVGKPRPGEMGMNKSAP